jgi:hypothetical protein
MVAVGCERQRRLEKQSSDGDALGQPVAVEGISAVRRTKPSSDAAAWSRHPSGPGEGDARAPCSAFSA